MNNEEVIKRGVTKIYSMNYNLLIYMCVLTLLLSLNTCNSEDSAAEHNQEENEAWLKLFLLREYYWRLPVDSCPLDSEIEELTTGSYTRNLQSGQKYWFDLVDRRNGGYSSTYTIQINEAVGQEIKLYSISCNSQNPQPVQAKIGDSGMSGQIENILTQYFREDRVGFYYFQADSGFGSFNFVVP